MTKKAHLTFQVFFCNSFMTVVGLLTKKRMSASFVPSHLAIFKTIQHAV